jgi:hypothetical protein
LGVSVVPELTLPYFRSPELASVRLDAPQLSRRILVVRPKGRALTAPAEALLDQVMRRFPAPKRKARR